MTFDFLLRWQRDKLRIEQPQEGAIDVNNIVTDPRI